MINKKTGHTSYDDRNDAWKDYTLHQHRPQYHMYLKYSYRVIYKYIRYSMLILSFMHTSCILLIRNNILISNCPI